MYNYELTSIFNKIRRFGGRVWGSRLGGAACWTTGRTPGTPQTPPQHDRPVVVWGPRLEIL